MFTPEITEQKDNVTPKTSAKTGGLNTKNDLFLERCSVINEDLSCFIP